MIRDNCSNLLRPNGQIVNTRAYSFVRIAGYTWNNDLLNIVGRELSQSIRSSGRVDAFESGMDSELSPRHMTRKLAMLAIITLGFGCVPTHNVKPLPDFVNEAIQPGDKVIVTTKDGETIEFVVTDVTNEMLIGEHRRVAITDIAVLKKVSWTRPPSPCGGDEKLGCSVPLLVSLSSDVHEHYGRYFYDACAQHDYCYRHGFRTYGLDRDACDAEFLQNMRKTCPEPSRSTFGRLLDVINTEVDSRTTCLATAGEFHEVVRTFGESKFRIDASTFCEYNGPP